MGAWIETSDRTRISRTFSVAPYVGAWIETCHIFCFCVLHASHPTWVRGLKLSYTLNAQSLGVVAPYVGAWIETRTAARRLRKTLVAPYVGAWIETCKVSAVASTSMSHPTWVRGLKLTPAELDFVKLSRTLRGCVD